MTQTQFLAELGQAYIQEGITKILGKAITTGTTRNNVTYEEAELQQAAKTLEGKPLLKNHTNDVDAIVGVVTSSNYDDKQKAVFFTADIIDEAIAQKAKKGLLKSVSVGAHVKSMEKHGDVQIPRGIEFVELSLIPVPSDPHAEFSIAHSLQEALQHTFTSEVPVYKKNEQKTRPQQLTARSLQDIEEDIMTVQNKLDTYIEAHIQQGKITARFNKYGYDITPVLQSRYPS